MTTDHHLTRRQIARQGVVITALGGGVTLGGCGITKCLVGLSGIDDKDPEKLEGGLRGFISLVLASAILKFGENVQKKLIEDTKSDENHPSK